MEKTRKIRCFTTFIILIILIIILLIMNVCIGTVHISFKAAFATLYDHSDRGRTYCVGYPYAKSYRSDDTGWGISACRLSFADFFS